MLRPKPAGHTTTRPPTSGPTIKPQGDFSLDLAAKPIDFNKQIVPIIEQHCVRCHSPSNNKGDVSLATFDDLKSNEYVLAEDADGNYLIELVTSQNGEPTAMPKEGNPLSDAEVDLLRQWIREGAMWPDHVVIKDEIKGVRRC